MGLMNDLYEFMSKADIEWSVCGGNAIDLFVGRQTRLHKDIDIAVYWESRKELIQYMIENKWRVFEPENGLLREITCLENDYRINDNLWCTSGENSAYCIVNKEDNFYKITTNRKNQVCLDFIEFLFNHKDGVKFLYKRNHNIYLENAIKITDKGIPYLVPEMVLLYKAAFIMYTNSTNKEDIERVKDYRHDFNVSYGFLSLEQKEWLKNALSLSYPNGHEWLQRL